MGKYTSPSERADACATMYNISREEAKRICTEQECMLSLDELKMKYGQETLGVMPSWLTEDDLARIINCQISTLCAHPRYSWISREDLRGDLQVYIRTRLHMFQSHGHLKVAVMNYIRSYQDQHRWRSYKHAGNLEDFVGTEKSDSSQEKATLYDVVASDYSTTSTEDTDFLNTLNAIKSAEIRNILIITGYLICNISILRKDYLKILRTYDDAVQADLKKIEETLLTNDDIDNKRLTNEAKGLRKTNICMNDIIRAVKFNRTNEGKVELLKDTFSTIVEYLENTGNLKSVTRKVAGSTKSEYQFA